MNNRLQTIAHYVIFRRRSDELGRTKLAKVLVMADVMMYCRHGRTISGDMSVTKRQHGPVPRDFFSILESLKSEGKVIERKASTPVGTRMEYVWAKEPNLEAFSGEEIAIVEEAAGYICENFSAASVSEATHDALWDETPIGGEIPIPAMAARPGEITPEIMAWARD